MTRAHYVVLYNAHLSETPFYQSLERTINKLFPKQHLPKKLSNLTKHVLKAKDKNDLSSFVPVYSIEEVNVIGPSCGEIDINLSTLNEPNTLIPSTMTNHCICELETFRKKIFPWMSIQS